MWARIAVVIIGIWLMAAPAVLGYGQPASTNDRIFGPTAAAVAIIAISEVTRPLRRVNLVMGLWLLIAPFVLGYEAPSLINSIAAGAGITALSFLKGKVKQSFGGGWRSLLSSRGPSSV